MKTPPEPERGLTRDHKVAFIVIAVCLVLIAAGFVEWQFIM